MRPPPSGSLKNNDASLDFIIGRSRSGGWLVAETHNLYGGVFSSRTEALRYARFETANRHATISVVDAVLENWDADGLPFHADPSPQHVQARS
ncbi:MAG: hypothetical protein JWL86_2410 [Rhizobium sp.]|nr:hypothetical protein [Rhizobium sp.]